VSTLYVEPCDQTMVVSAGSSIGLGIGSSTEDEPRAWVALSPAEARKLAGALTEAAASMRRAPGRRRERGHP
jgi:hypothetical protein